MHDGFRVLAGECTITFEGTHGSESERQGDVLVVCKPDNTVLVNDADGYQPVAWLTRAESVSMSGGSVTATDGDQHLRVETREEYGSAHYPASTAGTPVGHCPTCDGTLVRADGSVTCRNCDRSHGLPRDATVLSSATNCECGLPRIRVQRGRTFRICLDRHCESLDERVQAAFDREWDCPACGDDLRVLRRGGLIAGCERYPDCDTGFSIPAGTIVDECGCGLPVFETANGRRCLDSACQSGPDCRPPDDTGS